MYGFGKRQVEAMCVSMDAPSRLVVGLRNGQVQQVDARSQTASRIGSGHDTMVTACALYGGCHCYTRSADGCVCLWDARASQRAAVETLEEPFVHLFEPNATFATCDNVLYIPLRDSVRAYEMSTGRLQGALHLDGVGVGSNIAVQTDVWRGSVSVLTSNLHHGVHGVTVYS